MASNSKSGSTKEERESFLKKRGYVQERTGKGSHEIWTNPTMRETAKAHHIDMPENLRSNIAQKPWDITLPDNPAGGTWMRIQRQAEWCQKALTSAHEFANDVSLRQQTKQQMRDNMREICEWKHAVKHSLRMSQPTPPAPKAYGR